MNKIWYEQPIRNYFENRSNQYRHFWEDSDEGHIQQQQDSAELMRIAKEARDGS